MSSWTGSQSRKNDTNLILHTGRTGCVCVCRLVVEPSLSTSVSYYVVSLCPGLLETEVAAAAAALPSLSSSAPWILSPSLNGSNLSPG